jgi:4-hydroxy-tetrahydrodipicolinate reductase
MSRRYRVVQWATGNIGTRALRAVIEHPDLELVGVYVHSKAKAGRDAGELCGLPPLGVKATNSIEDIVALRADCVLYMPQLCKFDEVIRLLAAGCNIVTTRGEFNNPARLAPAMRDKLEAACRQGNSSAHGTGSSPGFITEALPLVLTSIQRRLDHLLIEEFADLSSRNSPELLFGIMGFGNLPKKDEWRAAYLRESFGPSLQLVAEAIGLGFDSIEAHGEVALARHDFSIAAGKIAAGTVAAQRTTVQGMRSGKPLVSFCANWYCGTEVEPDWALRPTGWHLLVEGDTPLDVSIGFPVEPERWASVSPGLTAHRAVNAIPYVCEAAPGLRSTIDLPQIIARLS